MSGDALSWIEGSLDRVVWSSTKGSYAVVRLEVEGEPLMAVGDLGLLAEAEPGSFVALEGTFEKHNVHGRQFRARGFLQNSPRTEEGLKLYLGAAGIPGVGKRLAARIVDAFGMGTLDVLANHPERLKTVEGIGTARARVIQEKWRLDEEGRSVSILLRGLGLNQRQIDSVKRRFRDRTPAIVFKEPYRLAEEIRGIGFRTADQLARQQGLPADDPARVRAGTVHVLDQASKEGHCFLPHPALVASLEQLGVPTAGLDDALAEAESRGSIVREPTESSERIWASTLYEAEEFVARELTTRAHSQAEMVFGEEATLQQAEAAEGIELDESQREAVRAAMQGGVVVVTGGPGTGKTTLLKVLLRAVGAEDWLLASPTGRAAKRLQEATGRPASTLHRLLEFNPGEGGFQRNVSNPLEGSGLIVDEASMIDIELLRSVMEALPYPGDDFGLVLVGDADQLPSVGPGQVLRDIIRSGAVPTVRLNVVHRQAAGSDILTAAHAIRGGHVPPPKGPNGDFFSIQRSHPSDLRRTLLTIVNERLPAKGITMESIQVLTPTRKGPLGTAEINRLLQQQCNTDGEIVRKGERELREGDRVICTRNRYDLDVFNGDMGKVLGRTTEGLRIRFEGRILIWPWDDLNGIELAYAITVHKSQGSEYAAVILLLHPSHGIMLRRNLFYTAVTRAKAFLCVLGEERGWSRAVRQVEADARFTGLERRLQEPT